VFYALIGLVRVQESNREELCTHVRCCSRYGVVHMLCVRACLCKVGRKVLS
jgi:hypothetical protein